MEILYIESKLKNLKISLSNKEIKKLPNKIDLLYTIQYKELAYNIAKQIKKTGIKINKIKQILGCSIIKSKSILFIGTGKFHLNNLILQNNEIYIIKNNQIIKIPEDEINKLRTREKTSYLKFLHSNKIGILVSIKKGQYNIEKALKLKKQLEKKGKSCYIFLSDNININEFDNFNIDSWVNTACPGLFFDNLNIININKIKNN